MSQLVMTENILDITIRFGIVYLLVFHPHRGRDGTFQRHRPVIITTARKHTTQKLQRSLGEWAGMS